MFHVDSCAWTQCSHYPSSGKFHLLTKLLTKTVCPLYMASGSSSYFTLFPFKGNIEIMHHVWLWEKNRVCTINYINLSYFEGNWPSKAYLLCMLKMHGRIHICNRIVHCDINPKYHSRPSYHVLILYIPWYSGCSSVAVACCFCLQVSIWWPRQERHLTPSRHDW